ncbi:hypothetical protein NP233_g11873 [Leucocoprinus birnbaumii]|uniref:Uncharacterized protein n=1 Tax=Leucocoprinus birnbaumii TaxID=56174 RepID=A0AAD5YKY3_9AGAR|nr:hypothetical protein NP233_g11873 [Leucocoprinus birnbaumii]
MIPFIPPELTDIIIRNCTSTFSLPSNGTVIDREARFTLLACSLVCRNWLPASRSLIFSQIEIQCTANDLSTFEYLISSRACTFLNYVQEITIVIPETISDVASSGLIENIMMFPGLQPACIRIYGGRHITSKRNVFMREQIRLSLAEAFTRVYRSRDISALPTKLILSTLVFESSSDLTLFLRSFASITSLHLDDLSFMVYSPSPHMPPQQLEKLQLTGSQVVERTLMWLASFHRVSRPPVRELLVEGLREPREIALLVSFMAVDGGVLERVEVGFEEPEGCNWRWGE